MTKRAFEEEPQVIRHHRDAVVMWAQAGEWSLCIEAIQEAQECGFEPAHWLRGIDYPELVAQGLAPSSR